MIAAAGFQLELEVALTAAVDGPRVTGLVAAGNQHRASGATPAVADRAGIAACLRCGR
jgi:hypothetical protein